MLQAANDEIDFRRQDIDIAIRWGAGGWNGAAAERLVDDVISPVCSPEFRDRQGSAIPAGCTSSPSFILSDRQHLVGLACGGRSERHRLQGHSVFQRRVADAGGSRAGQGICLATTLLVQADLRSGRLVRPFPIELAPAEGYHLLVDARHADRPAVAAFRVWIARRRGRPWEADAAGTDR